MSFIKLTTHAKNRALQRYAISADKLLELAETAVMRGVGIGDCKNKRVKKWLEKKRQGNDRKYYIYGSYLFIYVENPNHLLLITCLDVPTIIKLKLDE